MRRLVLQIPQHYKYKERAKYKKEIPLNRWHQRLLGLPKYKLPNITDMYKSEPTSDKWHQRLLGLPQKPWLLPITRQGTRYKVQVQNTQYKLANLGNIRNTNRTYLWIGDTRARGGLGCSSRSGWCQLQCTTYKCKIQNTNWPTLQIQTDLTSEYVTPPEAAWVAPEAVAVADVGGLTNFRRFTAALLTW